MNVKLNPNYPHLLPLIENLDEHFQKSSTILYDARNQIRVVSFEGEDYVVKAFKVPNLINRIAYRYFRPSKAKRSYEYSLKIGKELCPEPVAYIEEYNVTLLAKSYYISRFYNYDYTIQVLLYDDDFKERKQILEAFADFTFHLHEKGILHRDYSHGNILVKKLGAEYQFKVIDVNRMQFKELDIEERMNNFSRLNPNDKGLKIITEKYASHVRQSAEELYNKAIQYRDEYARQRAMKNKLRGKKE